MITSPLRIVILVGKQLSQEVVELVIEMRESLHDLPLHDICVAAAGYFVR